MTLIDKAEALAPCPFCGGGVSVTTTERVGGIVCDAPSECIGSGLLIVFDLEDMETALAAWNRRAIPARGVGVKPLNWQLCAGQDGVYYHAFDPLYGRDVEAPNEATCDAVDQNRAARILAALAPTDAPHVKETPKSEHDGADVLTDATTEKGGDAHAVNPRHAPHEASPGVTAGADAAQAPAEDAHVKGETDGQMLERLGMDGVKWAAEFRTTALRLGYSDMDEGWLIGWFCNAIMAGYDRSAAQAREAALHPDDMLPEAIRLIRQEASRDHSQEVVTGLKHIALLLEQLIGEARDD